MLGAIIGSLVSSIYNFGSSKSEDIEFQPGTTTDVALTLGYQEILEENLDICSQFVVSAVNTIVDWESDYVKIKDENRKFLFDWFWGRFKYQDVYSANHYLIAVPLNGSTARTLDEVIIGTEELLEDTGLPDEEIAAAKTVSAVIYKAKLLTPKDEIMTFAEKCINDIKWRFGEEAFKYDRTPFFLSLLPHAMKIFNNSQDFDDALRRAVKYDSYNTPLIALVGEMAEAYYGIPEEIKKKILKYLSDKLIEIFAEFSL